MMSAESLSFIAALVLLPLLCVISIIDLRKMIIPDHLNFLLAMCGLAYQYALGNDAVIQLAFAGVVLCSFWLLRAGHARLSGRIGLGMGDVKFLGAAALWVAPPQLPIVLFAASVTALMFVAARIAVAGQGTMRERVPFGPFLSLGLACAWAYEQSTNLGAI